MAYLATVVVAIAALGAHVAPEAEAYSVTGCKSSNLAAGTADTYATGSGMTSWYGKTLDQAAPQWWRKGVEDSNARHRIQFS